MVPKQSFECAEQPHKNYAPVLATKTILSKTYSDCNNCLLHYFVQLGYNKRQVYSRQKDS